MSLVEMMKSRYRASEKHRLEPNSTSTSCQKKNAVRGLSFLLFVVTPNTHTLNRKEKKNLIFTLTHSLTLPVLPLAAVELLLWGYWCHRHCIFFISWFHLLLSLSLFLSILQLLSSTWTNIFPHQATCLYTDTSVMSRTCTSDTGTGRLCQGAKNSFWSCVVPTSKCSGDLVHQSHLKCGRRERLVENSRVGSDGPSYSGLSTTSQDVIFYTRDLMECFCWSPWK